MPDKVIRSTEMSALIDFLRVWVIVSVSMKVRQLFVSPVRPQVPTTISWSPVRQMPLMNSPERGSEHVTSSRRFVNSKSWVSTQKPPPAQ